MGTFKKFIGGVALEAVWCYGERKGLYQAYTVPAYKDVDGTSRTTIGTQGGTSTTALATGWVGYAGLIPVATADDIDDYQLGDYQITEVGTTTYSRSTTITNLNGIQTFSVTITNESEEDIIVKCIKFKKRVQYGTNYELCNVLVCGYYLDQSEWVTIPAGEVGAVAVVMTVGA